MTSVKLLASAMQLNARSWRVPPIKVTQNSTEQLAASLLGNAIKAAKTEGNPPAGSPEVPAVRRRPAEAQLADDIERTVAAAPPLTGEQQARLSLLFDPSGAMPHEL